MPQPILFFLILCLASAQSLAERGPAVPDYPAEEVAPGVYVIQGPLGYPSPENQGFMNNPTFIVTDQGVVVVDPGGSLQTGEMVLRQMAKITDKPLLAVLNTHVHGDHWLGNQAMREANAKVPIYAHPKMLAAVEAGVGEEWIGRMTRGTQGATEGTIPVGPNTPVDQGDEIEIGGLTYRFHYYGHAHTHTDLMIQVVEKGVLFVGDCANNRRIVRMDDGSFAGSIAALERAKEDIHAKVLVPGHGQTGGWEVVDAYRDYLAIVYETVAALYSEGLSDFEMKPQVADKLSGFSDWAGFEEELGKHISLAFLEAEEAAF